ncbi:hypothetical protein Tco_1155781 [Tanacetum coccineum]
MMNLRRRKDRNGRRNEGEESGNPFFEGDDSSLFAEPEEWEGDGVADDDYEEAPVFDNDQYKEEIVKEESMPVYDTDIEDVIEEEEEFVGKRGLDGECNTPKLGRSRIMCPGALLHRSIAQDMRTTSKRVV